MMRLTPESQFLFTKMKKKIFLGLLRICAYFLLNPDIVTQSRESAHQLNLEFKFQTPYRIW